MWIWTLSLLINDCLRCVLAHYHLSIKSIIFVKLYRLSCARIRVLIVRGKMQKPYLAVSLTSTSLPACKVIHRPWRLIFIQCKWHSEVWTIKRPPHILSFCFFIRYFLRTRWTRKRTRSKYWARPTSLPSRLRFCVLLCALEEWSTGSRCQRVDGSSGSRLCEC